MSLTHISIDADMLARVDATSLANSVSREEALLEALANYCEHERGFRAKVEERTSLPGRPIRSAGRGRATC